MKSEKLFNLMIEKGYPNGFAEIISRELHTEFTANRMIGYISAREMLPMEEVADEMLAILSDRDRLINKHISQDAQDTSSSGQLPRMAVLIVAYFT